jgi:hypothetical protein
MKPLPCILALAALTALSSGCLAKSKDAQGDGYYWPPLSVSAGGQIFAGVDTKMRLDSDNLGIGTEIDLEDDFDVDDDVFAGRIDANWRFAKRHALDLSVFDLRRNGTRAIDRDIQIGDEVFPVGTAVESEFETRVARLAYQWSFWRRERWNAGLSFGIHWFDLRTGWEAGAIGVEQDFDAKAPLPVLGLLALRGNNLGPVPSKPVTPARFRRNRLRVAIYAALRGGGRSQREVQWLKRT